MKRPSPRTWIILGLSAAAVIAAGAFAISRAPVPHAPSVAADQHAGPSSSPAPTTAAPGTGGGAAPGDGSAPPAAGKRYSTEVLPVAPSTAPALPPSTPLPYPVSAPLPESASAVGKLADGYPSSVLPQAPGSTIATSSIASQGGHLQVTLTAGSTQQVVDIIAFYRSALAKYGMYDSPAPAVSGSTSTRFARDGNAVTLTVTPAKGGATYAVFGAFTAAG